MKTLEQISWRYARGSLQAFLEGKKNLNWLLGVLNSSGVRGQRLQEAFDQLRGYGDSARHDQALQACRKQGLLG